MSSRCRPAALHSRITLCNFGLLALWACSDSGSPEAMYQDYIYRLQNVSGIESGVSEPILLPAYPRHRDLVRPVTDIRIDFSDFFSLADCDLLRQIGERNSSLGRFQRPSQRLIYEIQFFRTLVSCEEKLQRSGAKGKDVPILTKVQEIRTLKSQNLPVVFWNATFAAPEFEVLLTTRTPALQLDQNFSTVELTQALEYLNGVGQNLKAGNFEIQPDRLENHYFVLQRQKLLGRLLQGMGISEQYLSQAAGILEAAARSRRLCPHGKKTEQADFLWNVFQKFYIGKVQRYLSKIDQPGQSLLNAINRLVQVQRLKLPPEFVRFHQRVLGTEYEDGLWARYRMQIRRHTKAMQALFDQCGLRPGQDRKSTT